MALQNTGIKNIPGFCVYVSDGTIKMFVRLVLLYDPKPRPLFCIEEQGNQLHPLLMLELGLQEERYEFNIAC
jgi:predicted ATPase